MHIKTVIFISGALMLCSSLAGAGAPSALQESRISVSHEKQEKAKREKEEKKKKKEKEREKKKAEEEAKKQDEKQTGQHPPQQEQATGTPASTSGESQTDDATLAQKEEDAAAERARCLEIAARQFEQSRTNARIERNQCMRSATDTNVCDIRYQESLARIDDMQSNWIIMNCYGNPEEYYRDRP